MMGGTVSVGPIKHLDAAVDATRAFAATALVRVLVRSLDGAASMPFAHVPAQSAAASPQPRVLKRPAENATHRDRSGSTQ